MKKIFAISLFGAVFAIFLLPVFSTEFDSDILSKPHRYFEIGVDSNTAVANNLAGVQDVFKKDIVIDLQQISNDLSGKGFNAGFFNQEQVFMNLNISSRFRFSFFAGVEASSHINISDELFKLLGSGISVGDSKTVDVTGYADVFANVGASIQTLIKGYGVKITPTYYIPIVYVPKTKATGSITTNSNGDIIAKAEADLDIYTAVNMHDFMEESKSFDSLDLDVADLLSNGGFDLSLDIDRNWFHNFNAGLYTRIPILPGKLNYKMHTRAWMSYEVENVLDSAINDKLETPKKPEYDDFTYTEETYKAYRPFRLGLSASYSPFGQWFKIQPSLGIALRNPYTSGERIFYPEYSLDLRLYLLKRIFNFSVGTAYQNQIFQQRFGFSLNLRVIEILAQASICGTSFKSSFERNGYGAMVGFRMGF